MKVRKNILVMFSVRRSMLYLVIAVSLAFSMLSVYVINKDKNQASANYEFGSSVKSGLVRMVENLDGMSSDAKSPLWRLLKYEMEKENQESQLFDGKSVCSTRTSTYLNNKKIVLNQEPFRSVTEKMRCELNGALAVFEDMFVIYSGALLYPDKLKGSVRGGEEISKVWGQNEQDEYFTIQAGGFSIPCKNKPPTLSFKPVDHLQMWAEILSCYDSNSKIVNNHTAYIQFKGLTIAIQRYEYVNLYHTMTDFYNAFIIKLLFSARSMDKVKILFVDAHPTGNLDGVWATLFGNFYRAGRLSKPAKFDKLVWGMLGYASPLNQHQLSHVPYLEEFRDFFLTQHSIKTSHNMICTSLKVLVIFRRNYAAHPRNKKGRIVRKFTNGEEIVRTIKKTMGTSLHFVIGTSLEGLSMQKQLALVSESDILFGMHGAGLSHTLFLPKTSGLIELFPRYSQELPHFASIARWRGLHYVSWQNDDTSLEQDGASTTIPTYVVERLIGNMKYRLCGKT